jgi:hypothetical protein
MKDYKSEADELQDEINFLKKVIIFPLALSFVFSLAIYLIKFI